MNAALFILAASCIVMAGLILHVAIRCNKLIDENRSFRATIRTLSTENESLKEKNLRKHVAMNRLARKCRQRGKTISKREQLISQLKAEVKVLSDINAKWAEKQNELLEQNTKLLKTIGEQETRNAELKQREQNCPFQRCRKNRIVYCMKGKK